MLKKAQEFLSNKNSARFLVERFYYASLRDGILALAKLSE